MAALSEACANCTLFYLHIEVCQAGWNNPSLAIDLKCALCLPATKPSRRARRLVRACRDVHFVRGWATARYIVPN